MIHFHRHLGWYLLKGEMTELFIANTIREFGSAIMGLFVPIYLYQVFGYNIVYTLFVLTLMHAGIIFFTPFAAKFNGRFGIKHTMLLSVPFLNIFLFALIKLPESNLFLIPLILGFAISIPLYWIGLHVDFARYSNEKKRGFSVGGFRAFMLLAALLGPFFGGLIISTFGFPTLFLIVIILETVALLPLFLTPDTHEPYTVSIFHELRSVFRRNRWKDIAAFASEGFEMKTGAHIWPIYIFLALGGVVAAGGITTASLLVAMLLGLLVGHIADVRGRGTVMRIGVFGTVLSWLARVFVATPTGIFLSDSFSRLSSNVYQVPYLTLFYDRARKYGERLEHYIIIREIAHSIGAVFMMCLAMLFFTFVSPSFSSFFILAAAASLFLLLYPYGER